MMEAFPFQLTKKQLIWIPVLHAYGRDWPVLFCSRRSASSFQNEEIYKACVSKIITDSADLIREALKRNDPKTALFGKFPESVGVVALNGEEKVTEVKTVKVLIKPSNKTPMGFIFYNTHPVLDSVLENEAPLRLQYPTLSRLMAVYYDEDFYDENSEDPQNPLMVMAEFCFEESPETVRNLLEEIIHYLQRKPTPEAADAFLTSLGNEFYYQASEINAIEWLEYLRVRLEQWVFHGDEPISAGE